MRHAPVGSPGTPPRGRGRVVHREGRPRRDGSRADRRPSGGAPNERRTPLQTSSFPLSVPHRPVRPAPAARAPQGWACGPQEEDTSPRVTARGRLPGRAYPQVSCVQRCAERSHPQTPSEPAQPKRTGLQVPRRRGRTPREGFANGGGMLIVASTHGPPAELTYCACRGLLAIVRPGNRNCGARHVFPPVKGGLRGGAPGH